MNFLLQAPKKLPLQRDLLHLLHLKVTFDLQIVILVLRHFSKMDLQSYFKNSLILDFDSAIDFAKFGLFAQVSRRLMDERLNISLGTRMDMNTFTNKEQQFLKQKGIFNKRKGEEVFTLLDKCC